MEMLTLGGCTPDAIPRLETPDLLLRAPQPSDLPAATAMHRDPDFYRHLSLKPEDEETVWRRMLAQAGHWAFCGYGSWSIEEKVSGAFVGNVGFFDMQRDLSPSLKGIPEAGWGLAPGFHGRGYAAQALTAALAWADAHLPVSRTACIINPDNVASLRLASRCGYREYARARYHDVEVRMLERPRDGG